MCGKLCKLISSNWTAGLLNFKMAVGPKFTANRYLYETKIRKDKLLEWSKVNLIAIAFRIRSLSFGGMTRKICTCTKRSGYYVWHLYSCSHIPLCWEWTGDAAWSSYYHFSQIKSFAQREKIQTWIRRWCICIDNLERAARHCLEMFKGGNCSQNLRRLYQQQDSFSYCEYLILFL